MSESSLSEKKPALPDKKPRVFRDERGRLLPGSIMNPIGGKPVPRMRINRKDILKICEERGYNPIHAIIDIATDPNTSAYTRLDCAKEILQYTSPKLKQVQLTNAAGDGDATINITWGNNGQQNQQLSSNDVTQVEYDAAKQDFEDGMKEAHDKVLEALIADTVDDDEDAD